MKMKKMLVTMAATAVAAVGICAMSASAYFPTQWTYTYNEGAEESANSNIYVMNKKTVAPLGGNYYLHAMIPPMTDGNEINGNRYARSEPMQLEDGKQYKLTFWYYATEGNHPYFNNVRVADINNPGLGVGDREGGNEDNFFNTCVESKTIDGKEWNKCVYTFTYHASKSEEPCVYFLFRATYSADKTLEYFIDDCTVVAADDPTETNLLPNGDFDTPEETRNLAWNVFSNNGDMYSGMSVEKVSGVNIGNGVQGGNSTLRFMCPKDQNGAIAAHSNPFSLQKGKKYTLTFAIDGNYWGPMFNLRFAKAESPINGIAVVEGSTRRDWNNYENGWTEISGFDTRWKKLEFTANDDYENMVLTLSTWAGTTGTLYVDNVCLTEEGSDVNLINDGSFEDNVGNDYWNVQYINTSEECSMKIVETEDGATGPWWPDGTKAVRVFYPYGGSGEMFLWSKPIEGLVDGQEYTLKFYFKGDTNPYNSARFGLAGLNDVVPLSPVNEYPKIDGFVNSAILAEHDGGDSLAGMNSAKLTFTYHKLSNQNPRVYFRMRGPGYDPQDTLMYLDNFSLCATGSTKNLLKDGSFEGVDGKLTASRVSIAGEKVDGNYIYDKGTVKLTTYASNTTGADKTVTIIAAYYYGNRLVAMEKTSDTVETDADNKEISVDINIGEIDDSGYYKLKAFVWDSVDGMKPILAVPAQFEANNGE